MMLLRFVRIIHCIKVFHKSYNINYKAQYAQQQFKNDEEMRK